MYCIFFIACAVSIRIRAYVCAFTFYVIFYLFCLLFILYILLFGVFCVCVGPNSRIKEGKRERENVFIRDIQSMILPTINLI